jgi:DNA/RNA-binding domain of Phe-tRNA-synthetase-like protein
VLFPSVCFRPVFFFKGYFTIISKNGQSLKKILFPDWVFRFLVFFYICRLAVYKVKGAEMFIENELSDRVKLIVYEVDINENPVENKDIRQKTERLVAAYEEKWSSPSEALDRLQPARKIYRSLGIDPTRYRPASEALFRRAVNNKPMPEINAAVDAGNYISLRHLLPLGLYDREKISGKIRLRKGKEGEFYQGLGKPRVNLTGKYVLSDEKGPFGNPSSDSLRTSVTSDTRLLLLIIFCPLDFNGEKSILADAEEIYGYIGGKVRRLF